MEKGYIQVYTGNGKGKTTCMLGLTLRASGAGKKIYIGQFMKDDEYRAKEQLATIQDLLKKSRYKLKDYKLPVIPSSYYVELKEAQDAIREIAKELDKKPIVIKILNIRVDTARDLVFKIYNKTNDMIKASMMSEDMIIYGNRYRSSYPEVEQELEKATALFFKGQYDKSLEISKNAIDGIESEKNK